MGTHCITNIHEMKSVKPDETIICSFFRHWDGMPEEHGRDLVDWLKGKILVNGIRYGSNEEIEFNRAGTMAVKLMNHIQDISGAEVIPTNSQDNYCVDYIYDIYFRDNKFVVIVDNDKTVEEFINN